MCNLYLETLGGSLGYFDIQLTVNKDIIISIDFPIYT